MSENKSWITWTCVGFTEEEVERLRDNPIRMTCGTCNRDLTGHSEGDVSCNNSDCPVHNYAF